MNSFPVQICRLGINIEQIYKMNSETIIVSTCAPWFLFLYHFTFKRRFISGVSKMIPSFLSVVRTWHVFCQNKELLKNTGRKTDKPEVQRLPLFHNSPSCEAHPQETQDWPEDHRVRDAPQIKKRENVGIFPKWGTPPPPPPRLGTPCLWKKIKVYFAF